MEREFPRELPHGFRVSKVNSHLLANKRKRDESQRFHMSLLFKFALRAPKKLYSVISGQSVYQTLSLTNNCSLRAN